MSGSCYIIVASASPPPTLLHRIYMGVAVLLLFEFYDYPLLLSVLFCTWHPPSLSSYFLFPLHHPPHPSVHFGLLWKGDGRRGGEWKRGMGMRREGKRAWKAGQRGVSGCKRERKMIVRVCQWELSPLTDSVLVPLILSDVRAGLFIQSFGDTRMHCMKILSALFFFFLLHFFFLFFNNCGVQECFHVGTFPLRGGIIFPKIKATASLPHASSLGCLYFWVEY